VKNHRSLRVVAAVAAACLTIALLPGCLAGGRSKTQLTGDFVGSRTLSQIEPGETDKAWVLAVLGEPTSRTHIEATGTEVWKWRYRKVEKSSGHVFLLVRGADRDETVVTTFVEFDGDVVKRAWRDRS